jgi:outer membrane protein assembly factor BamB
VARPHLSSLARSNWRRILTAATAKWALGLTLATAGATLLGAATGCQQHQEAAAAPKLEAIPANSFQVKQYALLPTKDDQPTDVYLRDPFVIVYTQKHFAYVLDRGSLGVKWIAEVTGPGTRLRPPVVLKDYVVFPTLSALEVYDRNGKNHRTVPTRSLALRSGAVGVGTHVLFGGDFPDGSGRVVDMDLAGSIYQNASVKWELSTRGGISGTPAVHQGLAYIGDDAGNVYAVNAETRAAIWPLKEEGREEGVFNAGGQIKADVKADDFGVYVASMDSKLYCLGRTDGRIRWRYFGGQPLTHSPDVTATTVYIRVDGEGLVAIDKTKGDAIRPARWTVKDAVAFLAEDEHYAYLQTQDHGIIAVDVATGQVKFKSKHHNYVAMSTALKGNTIYAVTADGKLRAAVPVTTAGGFGELAEVPAESGQPVMASTH